MLITYSSLTTSIIMIAWKQNHSISRTFILFNFTEYDVYNFCLHLMFTFLLQGNSSGSTAVCTFIRGKTIYAAWLGDSQAILVRNGQAVKIIEPHKPNRPVSWKNIFGIGVKFDLLLTIFLLKFP